MMRTVIFNISSILLLLPINETKLALSFMKWNSINVNCTNDDFSEKDVQLEFVKLDSNGKMLYYPVKTPLELLKSGFVASCNTKILIHGWQCKRTSDIFEVLPHAYLKSGKTNVILVNWIKGSSTFYYPLAAQCRTRIVGQYVSKFLKNLLHEHNLGSTSVFCVGHSLGAHICGFVGKYLKPEFELGAIIGLDPAGPLFNSEKNCSINRIDHDDCTTVMCIRTNAGYFGSSTPYCDVDFYVNGGRSQPICKKSFMRSFDLYKNIHSHEVAVKYFAECIKNTSCFRAYPAEYDFVTHNVKALKHLNKTCHMHEPDLKGYHLKGIYYVQTSECEPYCN